MNSLESVFIASMSFKSLLPFFSGIPFTMQRLCELLTQPKRHYKRVDKFMRGLEKVN